MELVYFFGIHWVGGVFEMDMKKGDPSFTSSLAKINMTPDCRLSLALTSLLNPELYPLSGSSSPCRTSFRLASIFCLSLIVANVDLNFSLNSSHESMDLDGRD